MADGPRIEPHRVNIGEVGLLAGQGEDCLRRTRLGEREMRRGMDRLHPGQLARDIGIEDAFEPCGLARHRLHVADHLRAGQQEVDVMRIVAVTIKRVLGCAGEIGLIGARGGDIRLDRIPVASDPVVNMRGHVDEMAQRARSAAVELVRGRFRPLGIGPVFKQVDEQVRGLRMLRIARENGLYAFDRLADAWLRFLAFRPVVPRRGVHRRFCRQDLKVVVAGIGIGQRCHRIRILRVERGAIGIERIALFLRSDDRPLGLACIRGEFGRAFERCQRIAVRGVVHARVDVRAIGKRHAPPAHGAVGCETGSFAE